MNCTVEYWVKPSEDVVAVRVGGVPDAPCVRRISGRAEDDDGKRGSEAAVDPQQQQHPSCSVSMSRHTGTFHICRMRWHQEH